jgi:prepilin-type N-terminal cleavage/methylation domain-containing protein
MGAPYARARSGRPLPDGGMTIIELVVTLSLISAVALGASGLVRVAGRAAQIHGDRLDAQQGLRRAMERITEELRWAEAAVADPRCGPTGLCPDRVSVHIPGGNPYRQDQSYDVVFQHNPRQREVERRVGRGVNNLAAMVDGVAVTYLDAGSRPAVTPAAVTRIRITLTARPRDGSALVLESEVGLRNHRIQWTSPPAPPATRPWRPSPRGFGQPASGGGGVPPPPPDTPEAR